MTIAITMPALSPTMTSGTLSKWKKKEGDKVYAGDIICEIETDKATMEVEAVDEGKLGKILVPEGTENVPVNTTIAILLEANEDASALENYKAETPIAAETPKAVSQEVSSPAPEASKTSSGGERIFASPLAKRMAEQSSINIAEVEGTGPHGRVIKRDVEAHLIKSPTPTPTPVAEKPVPPPATYDTVYFSAMRKVIAERLTDSKQNIPHFYLTIEVHMDTLMELRQTINEKLTSGKITINDFMIKATAVALKEFPDLNATFHDDHYKRYRNVDMAVAVSVAGGLITPIVKQADQKSIKMISEEVKDLAERAKANKLKPEEYKNGSFTISNLGMYGIKHFQAIINPPQVAILAVGGPFKDYEGKTALNLTLSVDHRVGDGVLAAQFLNKIKFYLENPLVLFAM